MKQIEFGERPNLSYIDFLHQKVGGTKISDFELVADNDVAKSKVYVIEKADFRIVAFEYTAKEDTEYKIIHDPKYNFTMSIFARDVIYYNEGKKREISVPNGFIFAKGTEEMFINFKKGVTKYQIVYAFNQDRLSDHLLKMIEPLNNFIYHIGNENILAWKNSFSKKLRENIDPKFRPDFVRHKLKELEIILLNTLFLFNTDNEEVLFTDYEIDTVFNIRDQILKSIHNRPVLKDLAYEYGINQIKLGKIFKEIFGKTLYKFYKDEKLQVVKSEIIKTKKTFTEIAYEYAFTDVNHLSKSCIEAFGMTPTELRKKS